MEKKLLDLKTKRAAAAKGMEDIFELTSKENRSRSAEEVTQFKTFEKEASDLDAEIRDLEAVIAEKQKSAKPLHVQTGEEGNRDISGKEIKAIRKYSVGKLMRATKSGKLDGLEKEMHEEALAELTSAGVDYNRDALHIPYRAMRHMNWTGQPMGEQRVIQATVSGAGIEAIETDVMADQYIIALRAKNVLMNAGIEYITNVSGNNIALTRENAVYTPGWAATENASASVTSPTYQAVTFSPKRLAGAVDLSNQIDIQAPWMEGYLRRQLVAGNAQAIDIAGINGSGGSGQPRGILNTSGVGTVVGGSNGASPTRPNIVNFEQQLGTAGADLNTAKWITNFKIPEYLKKTEFSTGSGRYLMDGAFIWNGLSSPSSGYGSNAGDGTFAPLPLLEYYPMFRSGNVPSNLTKGTSTTICSALIFMDVTKAKFMQWGGMGILVDPYTQALAGATRYVVNQYVDFEVLLPGAIIISVDFLTP